MRLSSRQGACSQAAEKMSHPLSPAPTHPPPAGCRQTPVTVQGERATKTKRGENKPPPAVCLLYCSCNDPLCVCPVLTTVSVSHSPFPTLATQLHSSILVVGVHRWGCCCPCPFASSVSPPSIPLSSSRPCSPLRTAFHSHIYPSTNSFSCSVQARWARFGCAPPQLGRPNTSAHVETPA